MIDGRSTRFARRTNAILCMLVAVMATGCGRLFPQGSGGSSSSGISVFLTSKFTSIAAGATAVTLTAQTQGDSTNAGVRWTLTANGTPCSNDCGFLSAITPRTATYTPPSVVPGAPANTPTISAVAVADSTQSDSSSFTINASGIAVTITNKVNAVAAGNVALPISFRAGAQNDPSNSGVRWSITSPGVDCPTNAAVCGTFSSVSPILAVYQPPTSASAPSVSVTATSIHDSSKSDIDTFAVIGPGGAVSNCNGAPAGNESLLNGHYAFFAQGTSVIAASFAADGAGHIQDLGGGVGGEIDRNDGNTSQHLTVIPTPTPPNPNNNPGSSYTVGPDSSGAGFVGCLFLYTSNGATTIFRFALGKVNAGVATEGRITEFDDQFASTSTAGRRASGPLRLQDPTVFVSGDTSLLQKNYTFGVGGAGGPHAVVVGAFVLDPTTGVISDSDFDSDDLSLALKQSDVQRSTGSIGSISAKTGRAVFTFTPNMAEWPGGLNHTQAAVYVVNSSELFLVTADSPNSVVIGGSSSFFLYAGRAIASGSVFAASSLSGNFILHETGTAAPSACSSGQCADVSLGLLTFNSTNSSVSATIFEYNAKNGGNTTTFAGSATYAVSSTSGRVTLSGAGLAHPPVFYLAKISANSENIAAFAGGTDPSAGGALGVLEPGASMNITTALLKGNYFFSDEDDPADPTINNRVGVLSISSTGGIFGTQLTSGPTAPNLLSSGPVSIAGVLIDNAHGFGTGNVGANTVAITDGSKLFFIDETAGTPASITVVESQ